MDENGPVHNEDQFWDELDDIVSTPCRTHDRIDDTLRTWLDFLHTNREAHVQSEHALLRVSYALLSSSLFTKNQQYIRRQITFALLQEDDPLSLHLAAAFLLLDGQRNEQTFELMNTEGTFAHLVNLIRQDTDNELGLHRQLLQLLYEMSRIQQIPPNQLTTVDDAFILHLFQLIERHPGDASDPYQYPVIRVLLVLNEQYMISTHEPSSSRAGSITNRVMKTLSMHGHDYKTFGENLILVLNRESETSLQFLILKLLYLLFTTPSTQEYFYTNDLYVLIDILVRNLLDLPPPSTENETMRTGSLRHTYLRVLHPLLAHTQLRYPPHYKQAELRRTLHVLAETGTHFERPDETTLRLVGRCLTVSWLEEPVADLPPSATAAVAVADAMVPESVSGVVETSIESHVPEMPALPTVEPPSASPSPDLSVDSHPEDDSATDPGTDLRKPPYGKPAVPASRRLARRKLGLQPAHAQGSTLSMQEVAEATEKPGVKTPSRYNVRPPSMESHSSALSVQEVTEATERPGVHTASRRRRGPQPPPPPVPMHRRVRKKSPFEDL